MSSSIRIDSSFDASPLLSRQTAATVVIANALEFFDYFAYATFVPFIDRAFFPHSTGAAGIVYSLGIFAAGFLARPVGAVLIGAHADAAGRKPALILTSIIVTLGTLGIAVIPGYATLGFLAPALVLLFRLLQGIAIGGELGVSASLLTESCPPGKRALNAGLLMAGQGLALVASGACGMFIFHFLSTSQVEQWGWRLPFALAAAMAPLQAYLRLNITENWIRNKSLTPTLREFARGNSKRWLIAIMLIFGGTVPTYMAGYIATFGIGGTTPSTRLTATATFAVGLASLVMSVVGGWTADRFGQRKTIVLARLATIVIVLPAFHIAALQDSASSLLLAIVTFAGLSTIAGGPTIVEILRMFPERQRALSLSLVYSIGVALFGGTAPLLVASVNTLTGNRFAAAWYITISSVVTMVALRMNTTERLHTEA